MPLHMYRDVQQLARAAADALASELSWAITQRGTASLAVSGGTTPWLMLTALARHPVAWHNVHLWQVDERAAPFGHADRSLTHIQACFLDIVNLPDDNVHAIAIDDDLDAAALAYSEAIRDHTQGIFDVVHLGLGDDGHTASLVPNDPVLAVNDMFAAATQEYRGYRRVTVTYPTLAAARNIVWLVNGVTKVAPLRQLMALDDTIPAGRVPQAHAQLFCDDAAVSPEPLRE